MEEEKAASVESVSESHSLCAGEREYVERRKKFILGSFNKLGINCTEDSVPHIALLGSGGGQRAAVGLLGSLYQMEKEKLLDSMLYLGGVSGSTWSMALLYTDPEWSKKMDEAINKLNSEVDKGRAQYWLKERAKEEDFSLSDIWGLMTTVWFMKQMELGHLSDGANRKTNNPYPIYCAIEDNCHTHKLLEGMWFEGTPHQAGFPELGLFVETSLLGSKFEGGELVEKLPEMDMVKLQGILGSALASGGKIRDYVFHWLNVNGIVNAVHEVYLRVYRIVNRIISFAKSIFTSAKDLLHLDSLLQLIADTDKTYQEEHPEHESKSDEEKKSIFLKWGQKLLSVVKDWYQRLEQWTLKEFFTFITEQVFPLVLNWEWGTTNNFLYKYKGSSVPEKLTSVENINLVDAGLMNNIPYPSFLGDKRDIDVIIALEYSAGDMFEVQPLISPNTMSKPVKSRRSSASYTYEGNVTVCPRAEHFSCICNQETLTEARNYAAKLKKPFPEIQEKILAEKNFPKACYVFEGEGKGPTIIYLPLFNSSNCKTQEEYDIKMKDFNTFQLPYDKKQTEELLNMAKENISNSSQVVLEEIKKAVARRQTKQGKSVQQ